MPASEDEAEQIGNLVKSISTDHNTGLNIKSTVAIFRVLFALNDAKLGQTHFVEHEIDTGDAGPITLAPYRLSTREDGSCETRSRRYALQEYDRVI